MISLDQFINSNNGRPLEAEDPSNLDQCFDLAIGWCDAIGLDRAEIRNLRAYQVWTNHGPNLTPTNTPVPGDFVIWGTRVGVSGHIAVFVSGNPSSFQSFDQNWDGVQYCRIVSHNNFGVLGF